MRRICIFILITVFLFGGCTGSFNVTKKVYNMHRDEPNKWLDETIFLCSVIVPVYGFAMIGDGFIFNPVEFWTGKNPIKMEDSKEK